MRTIQIDPIDLVNDSTVFHDSEGMIEDKFHNGEISEEEYDYLIDSCGTAETKQKVLDWKLEECSQTFINSIKRAGVSNPVAMLHNGIMNGHHRLAVGQLLGIKVPVDVYDTWREFENNHKWEVRGLVDCYGEQELGD